MAKNNVKQINTDKFTSTLKYVIVNNKKVIAAFLTESDRNLCIGALQNTYEDATFIAGEED